MFLIHGSSLLSSHSAENKSVFFLCYILFHFFYFYFTLSLSLLQRHCIFFRNSTFLFFLRCYICIYMYLIRLLFKLRNNQIYWFSLNGLCKQCVSKNVTCYLEIHSLSVSLRRIMSNAIKMFHKKFLPFYQLPD